LYSSIEYNTIITHPQGLSSFKEVLVTNSAIAFVLSAHIDRVHYVHTSPIYHAPIFILHRKEKRFGK